jgi:hypothetical protein
MNEESYSTEIVLLLFFKIFFCLKIHDIFFKIIFNTNKLKQYKLLLLLLFKKKHNVVVS